MTELSTMKSNWKNKGMRALNILLIGMMALTAACSNKDKHAEHVEYICPMHPTVNQDHPGSCPVCGMELVRKGQPGEEVKITSELSYLLKPTNAIITSAIKTVQPRRDKMKVKVEASGVVSYDTRRLSVISARTSGRIEKLYVKYNFQPVRKGQRLLELYSSDLETAKRELNYLLKVDKDNTLLINAAKEKLRLLGVGEEQMENSSTNTITIFSPVDGYIIEESTPAPQVQQVASAGSAMGSGMSSQTPASVQGTASKELSIREGMYLSPGQTAFRVIDTSIVWAEIDLYPPDASSIQRGDAIKLATSRGTDSITARIDFVQPFLKEGQSFVKVRAYLKGVNRTWSIGQLVTASIQFDSKEALWIPASASLDLGTRTIAFVKRRGVFRPTAITTSHRYGQVIAVVSGLHPTDSVASNAQFMIDSESFIKVRN